MMLKIIHLFIIIELTEGISIPLSMIVVENKTSIFLATKRDIVFFIFSRGREAYMTAKETEGSKEESFLNDTIF